MNVQDQRYCCLIAFAKGMISRADLEVCLAELEPLDPASERACILLAKGLLTEEQIAQLLAESSPSRATAIAPHGMQAKEASTAAAPASLTSTTKQLVGTLIGRYRVTERIGHGGMGAVYRARDQELDCDVALKVLLAGQFAETDDVERFRREARAIARLQHRSIVRLRDFGCDKDKGIWFFTMDCIDGKPLNDLIRASEVSVAQALDIAIEVAGALHHAHAHGVVHRDVKPGNILVDREGKPFLTDFGLAKRAGVDLTLTQPGVAFGSLLYMPPEQLGAAGTEPDARSDVYSLGATLHEMLTGQPVFSGSAESIVRQILTEEPQRTRSLNPLVSEGLERVVLKALSKSPDARWPTARAFADALEAERQKLTATQPHWVGPVRRGHRKAVLAAVALLVAAAAGVFWLTRPPRTPPRPAPGELKRLEDSKGLFSIAIPADWQVQRQPGSLTASEPEKRAYVSVVVKPKQPGGLAEAARIIIEFNKQQKPGWTERGQSIEVVAGKAAIRLRGEWQAMAKVRSAEYIVAERGDHQVTLSLSCAKDDLPQWQGVFAEITGSLRLDAGKAQPAPAPGPPKG